MIKVARLVETTGTQIFKKFLLQSFDFQMLCGEDKYFNEWRVKNMGTWSKYVNDDDVILEVYAETYKIRKPKDVVIYEIPIPIDINEFIEDMYRFNVVIYWDVIIDELFEPKDYLNTAEIRNYYVKLLTKMEKSFELI